MKKAPREERRLFAIQIHASHACSTVVDICQRILETPIKIDDPIYNSLIVAIYTTYGKPFTKCWGFGKLTDDLIPNEYKVLHGELITHRDKMYAHVDKDMVHEGYGPTNDIRISISPEGRCRVWTQPVQPTPHRAEEILKLASRICEKMDYWTERFIDKYMKNMDVEPGDYLLDTESDTGLLVKRDTEQMNRERMQVSRAVSSWDKSSQS